MVVRVQPIPGMIPIPGTDTDISVSVYRYRSNSSGGVESNFSVYPCSIIFHIQFLSKNFQGVISFKKLRSSKISNFHLTEGGGAEGVAGVVNHF